VIGTVFLQLERRGHVENLLAVLDRDDTAAGEARAVTTAVDLVHDRRIEVAPPQEIRMQRVHQARHLHGLARRHQGLAEHLAAEHLRTADVAALAAKEVHLDPLEPQQLQQVRERLVQRTIRSIHS
jgi:hypothetical protein